MLPLTRAHLLREIFMVHHQQMSVERIYSEDARNSSEDPLKEVSILQFLKAHGPHPNIIEVIEVRALKQEKYFW